MACLLVPAAEAIVVTAVNNLSSKKEKSKKETGSVEMETGLGISFHEKVRWLQNMLWGGSALLAFEHIWHGELVPWFPFLTAAKNPAELAKMFGEMSTVGVSMAALVTCVWGLMLLAANAIEKRTPALRGRAR